VWTKAVEDSAGLSGFYELNKTDWMGEQKARVITYTAKNQEVMNLTKKYLAKNMAEDDLLAKVNKKDPANLKIETTDFEKGKGSEIERLGWGQPGTTYAVVSDSSVQLLKIAELLPPAPKPLNEVKGYVVADYQESLEAEWIAELKRKYPVSVNEQVFRSLFKK
jgi:peptidyl-prolyl cis-trans isomerase SurA